MSILYQPMHHENIDRSLGKASVAPLASDQAYRNLNQLVVVQVVEVLQHAARLVVPRFLHDRPYGFKQRVILNEWRTPLPKLKAPIRWLNTPGRTLVEQGYNQQDSSLPRLQAPLVNQQWIDLVHQPDYKGGF